MRRVRYPGVPKTLVRRVKYLCKLARDHHPDSSGGEEGSQGDPWAYDVPLDREKCKQYTPSLGELAGLRAGRPQFADSTSPTPWHLCAALPVSAGSALARAAVEANDLTSTNAPALRRACAVGDRDACRPSAAGATGNSAACAPLRRPRRRSDAQVLLALATLTRCAARHDSSTCSTAVLRPRRTLRTSTQSPGIRIGPHPVAARRVGTNGGPPSTS